MKIVRMNVDGMTCSGCEQRIVANLQKIEGVHEATASSSERRVTVLIANHMTDLTPIKQRIAELGFDLKSISTPEPIDLRNKKSTGGSGGSGNQKKPKKLEKGELLQMAGLLGLVLFIWFISPNLGLTQFVLPDGVGYLSLFIIGLTTSIHCIGMCGGINMSISLSPFPSANPTKSLIQRNGSYQLGRVISYTLIGAVAGLIGSSFSISSEFKAAVTILAGIMMMLMGLNLLGLFTSLGKYLPKPPASLIQLREKAKKMGPLAVGLANGFIPCGPLQAMQLYALSTADPLVGGLSMFFFSLGTVPGMFGFGILSGTMGKSLQGTILRFSGVLVIFLGIIAMERGLAMSNMRFVPTLSDGSAPAVSETVSASDGVVATLTADGYQEVTINVTPSGYEPIIVQKGIPVRWNLKATEENLTGCNSGIVASAFNIEKTLVAGDNIVEFTPTESGKFRYTCWMGMIKSRIIVVDDLNAVSN